MRGAEPRFYRRPDLSLFDFLVVRCALADLLEPKSPLCRGEVSRLAEKWSQLRRQAPGTDLYGFRASELAVCAYMKVTTLPKVLRSLQKLEHVITVDPDTAARARTAIERMIAIGGQRPLSMKPETTQDPGE